MPVWIEELPEKMLRPISLIMIMPTLWICSFWFTQSFIGSLIFYAWLSVLFFSFMLLLVKEFHSDWLMMAYLNIWFFASLFQVLLYISLRVELLRTLL